MKTKLLKHLSLRATMLASLVLAAVNGAWAETKTVYYEPTSATAYSASETLTGLTLTISSTSAPAMNGSALQFTAGKDQTVSFASFPYAISKITLSMRSNKKTGTGTVSIKVGESDAEETTIACGTQWPSNTNEYSTYKDVDFNVTSTANQDIVISISASVNSLYLNKITFTYSDDSSTPDPGTVATPTFSPAAGAVPYNQEVTISAATDCVLTYTTDGSDPTTSGTSTTTDTNTATVNITGTTTIRAIALDGEANESDEASATYTIAAPTTPTFTPAAGAVTAGTTVEIEAEGADMILYTTDGSTPSYANSVGEEYTSAITIDAAMTIKAIAVDGGGNESEIATAAYTIKESISGLSIDFESAIDDYVDWTIANAEQGTSTISAHNGTYYGTTGGKQTASFMTKEIIAYPSSFTCYISKQSTNTTSSTWYIQVSTDKDTWTDVKSQSATSMTKGEWVEMTADLKNYTNVYVRLYYSGSTAVRNVDDITLTTYTPSSIATPVLSLATDEYFEAQSVTISCETDGASIYYTLDGTDPTSASTPYTGAITISETKTLKAIAIKDDESSVIASATYTFPTVYTTIAAFKAANTTGYLNVTGMQVVYVSGDNIYVRDATGGADFYKSGLSLTTGDVLSGIVGATYTLYNGLPELTTFTKKDITVSANETVVATSISTMEEAQANVCNLVKFENIQITGTNPYYIGETGVQLYDKFSVGYTPNTTDKADISGVVILYQKNNTGDITTEVCPRTATDIVTLSTSEAVSISAVGYATFSSTNALDFTSTDAIEVYIATTKGDGTGVDFTRIYKVPANTGVLLHSATGDAVAATNVPFLDGDADATTGNKFVAVSSEIAELVSTDGTKHNYILNKVGGVLGFYKAAKQTVAAGKAYIQIDEANGNVKGFIALPGFEDETGIHEMVNGTSVNGKWYNLSNS